MRLASTSCCVSLAACAQLIGVGEYEDAPPAQTAAAGGAASSNVSAGQGGSSNRTASNSGVGGGGGGGTLELSLAWARVFAGPEDLSASAIAVGTTGQIALCGSFIGSFDSGISTLTAAAGTPKPTEDIFLLRLNGEGETTLAERYGDSGIQLCNGITYDELSRTTLVGSYTGELDFGGTTTALQASTTEVPFAAVIAATGEATAAIGYPATGASSAHAVVANTSGVLLVGEFRGTLSAGDDGASTSAIESAGFVSRALADQNDWLLPIGNTGASTSASQRALDAGNAGDEVYVVGDSHSDLTIGTLDQLDHAGGADGFVVKVDTVGNPLWSLGLAGASHQELAAVAVTFSERIVVAGTTSGAATLGAKRSRPPQTTMPSIAPSTHKAASRGCALSATTARSQPRPSPP